jgi:glycosyltransferase involved in cell wall biosynthesis
MTISNKRRKVVVLQHRLLHYRTSLFDQLRARCLSEGIDLHLVHGQPTSTELGKRDTGVLDWADAVTNQYVTIGGRDILWQPFPRQHRDADLVIVMQENRLISNYPQLLSRLWSPRKIAYWGHGVNFQSTAQSGIRERWKRMMMNRVDWWFAYTQSTVDILRNARYPEERITCLNNAIDNNAFERDLAACSEDQLALLRKELGLSRNSHVALFCGSLYAEKRLGFMIEAADRIREALPDFHLVVIGDGPAAAEIRDACPSRPWLHWVGVKRGREKAAYFRLSQVVLNPGAVGLHVLDSFCAGVPMATTVDARHGPEIAYLHHGHNGLVTRSSVDSYAMEVLDLLRTSGAYETMRDHALKDGQHYTLANMIDRFADGLERCLIASKFA